MPPAHATLLPRDEMLRAFMASDTSYEGLFYTAVRTTGIFCRPTCSARKPKPENVAFYRSADDALAAGFRPCKRSRPLEVADAPDWVQRVLDEGDRVDRRRRERADRHARRRISVRAYDAGHMMVAATVCDGPEVGNEIVARFADPDVAYVHLHNAKRGCFSCLVVRA